MKLAKVTLNLYDGDREIIQRFYPKSGWSTITRELIHSFCRNLEERANREVKESHVNVRISINDSEPSES